MEHITPTVEADWDKIEREYPRFKALCTYTLDNVFQLEVQDSRCEYPGHYTLDGVLPDSYKEVAFWRKVSNSKKKEIEITLERVFFREYMILLASLYCSHNFPLITSSLVTDSKLTFRMLFNDDTNDIFLSMCPLIDKNVVFC